MMHKPLTILDAPSNLGLRPPLPGVIPGVYKLAGALRDQQIVSRLHATDGGVVVPPRYLPDWDGKSVRNSQAIASYSRRLANRIQSIITQQQFLLLLGGDCSILLGAMLALRAMGHYGLIFIDGHLDFRHPGNAAAVGSAAGEDLALVTGRGSPDLTHIDGLGPYVADQHVIALGCRDDDEYLSEVRQSGIWTFPASYIMDHSPAATGQDARMLLEARGVAGYWVHLDVDVVDAALLPAVDTPVSGGLTFAALTQLVATLLQSPAVVGMDVTVFDPDLDPDGILAQALANALIAAFGDA